jgi:type I restriction enzyme S subunit
VSVALKSSFLRHRPIGEFSLVTDYVANGSFASLRENVKYLSGAGYAVLVRLRDSTKNWNGDYVFVSEHAYRFLAKSSLEPGDIVVSNVGDPGQLFTVPDLGKPMTLGPNSVLVRPDPEVASRRYIFWYLQSPGGQGQVKSIVTQTAVRKFNKTQFRELKIPLPPLTEQRRIAEVLDQAEALRAKRRAALGQFDTFTQSLFVDLFGDAGENSKGWPVRAVADYVAEFQGGKSIESESGDNAITRNRVLKVSAVTGMKFLARESKPVPDSYEPSKEHFAKPGDLLFSRANTTELVGAVAYVESAPPNLLLPDKLWRFVWREPSAIEPLFVWALFQTPTLRREIGRRATGTSGSMKNISQEKVFGIRTILPPTKLQREFARRVQAVEKLKTTQRASLAELDALFATLQHRAFRGEL